MSAPARPRILSILTLSLLALIFASPLLAQGQGEYFNVESPQVHPIEVARINGHDYVLAVNTPDNAVEIWDTDETVPLDLRFLARIPVGLEPVSVRWAPELGRLYTANFLGDSVSVARVTASGGPATLSAVLERTEYAGDEPQDVALFPIEGDDGDIRQSLVVTQRSPDGWGWLDALTLQPIVPATYTFDTRLPSGLDIDGDSLLDDIALKEPRTVEVACNTLFMLGEKGGNTPAYDVDLWLAPINGGAQSLLGGLGSTNFAMEFDRRNTLYVTGGMALNTVLRDEPVVMQAPTGFVEHRLYRLDDVCSGNPTIDSRDLNFRGIGGGGQVLPVAANIALAQPTDLVVYEPEENLVRVLMAAYGSDRVGLLEGSPSQPLASWNRRVIDIRPGGARPVVNTAGSRGLALKLANPSQVEDPGDRLYVLNRIANSISVVDLASETMIFEFALTNDPTPGPTRSGRRFLYSARFGNGFNSCASCHIDARTDGIAWDLGDPDALPVPIPLPLFGFPGFPPDWPADKEHMVTQSLQGLLNFEVEPGIQDLVTNAPYHWRGDRATFLDFNGAFVSLLGGDEELEDANMERFETFINTVNYPPNPRQPLGRDYSGDFLGAEGVNSTGATLGMVAFHLLGTVGTTSCVHCHSLPEGSNNLLTDLLGGTNPHNTSETLSAQPIETAAMRGLFQKEARLSRNGSEIPENQPITGLEGLFHTGFVLNASPTVDNNDTAGINSFVRNFGVLTSSGLNDEVAQYTHELDWGVGPVVGISYTVDTANLAAPLTATARSLFENQANLANAGFAIQARLAGVMRGFYFDPTLGPPAYREEPGGTVFTWATLSALLTVPDDRLVMIATPLGSARRVAHPLGQPVTLVGASPTAPELLPMVPNTANMNISQMVFNWASGTNNQHGGASPHIIRLLQYGLIQSSPPAENAFGLGTQPRHDPPRRFRVASGNLRPGAELHLFVPVPTGTPGAITTLPPSPNGAVSARLVRLPLYPTDDVQGTAPEEVPIWETAVELDSLEYYTLMLGGLGAPGVATARADNAFALAEPPTFTFDATNFNWHYVRVRNADGTTTDGGWQRLRISP